MSKILIVEDDTLLSDMVKRLLLKNNYEVATAYSGSEAVLILEKETFDLVLLDLMLPGIAGEEVLAHLRENADIPVIGISAKTDLDSKVSLIKNGADDYITKPFDNKELMVRMEAVLRRYKKSSQDDTLFVYKDLSMNTSTMEVKLKDEKLLLTRYEYLILQLLMSEPNKVFTKNNIFDRVWNENFVGDENAINVHISNLRKKFSKINPNENYIKTVWGLGFKMEE